MRCRRCARTRESGPWLRKALAPVAELAELAELADGPDRSRDPLQHFAFALRCRRRAPQGNGTQSLAFSVDSQKAEQSSRKSKRAGFGGGGGDPHGPKRAREGKPGSLF